MIEIIILRLVKVVEMILFWIYLRLFVFMFNVILWFMLMVLEVVCCETNCFPVSKSKTSNLLSSTSAVGFKLDSNIVARLMDIDVSDVKLKVRII